MYEYTMILPGGRADVPRGALRREVLPGGGQGP